mmetsp:Transcript_84323/g.228526  ORF Transcript_84323/g.228526 Transcript_84323/m.228526 type:complete len:294 (-) Transcript_84323:8-889(-)
MVQHNQWHEWLLDEVRAVDQLPKKKQPHQRVDRHGARHAELHRTLIDGDLRELGDTVQRHNQRHDLVEEQPGQAGEPGAEEEGAQRHLGQEDVEVLRHVVGEVGHDAIRYGRAPLLRPGAPVQLQPLQVEPPLLAGLDALGLGEAEDVEERQLVANGREELQGPVPDRGLRRRLAAAVAPAVLVGLSLLGLLALLLGLLGVAVGGAALGAQELLQLRQHPGGAGAQEQALRGLQQLRRAGGAAGLCVGGLRALGRLLGVAVGLLAAHGFGRALAGGRGRAGGAQREVEARRVA